jgi:hypothetical protein
MGWGLEISAIVAFLLQRDYVGTSITTEVRDCRKSAMEDEARTIRFLVDMRQ